MPRLNLCNEFPRVRVGTRRIGNELKRWPALLQCLFGLQRQSRPSAAHIRENGLQSRIRRVCAHPLTISGPKPAFKWSKHLHPPKDGPQNDPDDDSVRVWRGGCLGRRGGTELKRYRTVRICYTDTVRPSDNTLLRPASPRGFSLQASQTKRVARRFSELAT
jgi:hypothetical protein